MNELTIKGLTPFIPGKNFELSKRFYSDIGFTVEAEIKNAVLFVSNGYGFWLQNYYAKEWAENSMLCLYVNDIKLWWSKNESALSSDAYGDHAKVFSEPHDQEGALMIQFCDPSGVLWHVREN